MPKYKKMTDQEALDYLLSEITVRKDNITHLTAVTTIQALIITKDLLESAGENKDE